MLAQRPVLINIQVTNHFSRDVLEINFSYVSYHRVISFQPLDGMPSPYTSDR